MPSQPALAAQTHPENATGAILVSFKKIALPEQEETFQIPAGGRWTPEETASILLETNPVWVFTEKVDGSPAYRQKPWDAPPDLEMSYCTSLFGPCQPEGVRVPFGDVPLEFDVEWIGPKEAWVAVEFYDAEGRRVPVALSEDGVSEDGVSEAGVSEADVFVDRLEVSFYITGTWAFSTPFAALPEPNQIATVTARRAYPVRGALEIETGNCCLGGIAGETITTTVAYWATSPYGAVTEMRTAPECLTEENIAATSWEPFAEKKAFQLPVGLSWTEFNTSVQFRDERGNLSEVYCDKISVEGTPAETPLPLP